jgi:hypothetical protein
MNRYTNCPSPPLKLNKVTSLSGNCLRLMCNCIQNEARLGLSRSTHTSCYIFIVNQNIRLMMIYLSTIIPLSCPSHKTGTGTLSTGNTKAWLLDEWECISPWHYCQQISERWTFWKYYKQLSLFLAIWEHINSLAFS